MLDPRRLLVLDAVVRAGSMSAASIELRYSPAAVSQQIAALEAEAGVALLERRARGVVPTAAGVIARRHAAQLAARLAQASDELDAVARGVSGPLRIASFSAASAALLPEPLRALAAERPDLRISVADRLPDEALTDLRSGVADLALVADLDASARVDTRGLDAVELGRAGVSVMLPLAHRLAGEDPVPLAELVDDRWIQSSDAVCAAIVARVAVQHDVTPQITTRVTDMAATRGLVAAGLGIALVSDLLGLPDQPGIVLRRVQPQPSHPVLAITPPDPLPAATELRERLMV